MKDNAKKLEMEREHPQMQMEILKIEKELT